MRLSLVPLTILTLILQAAVTREARAGEECDQWMAGPLHHQPEGLESDQIAFASTIWSPPTGGTLLVVGGSFESAGGVPVNYLAGWDGASWRDVGGGVDVNGFVDSLAVFNNELIVGGRFTSVGAPGIGGGPVPAVNIARFDGTNWHAMGQGLHGISGASCWALTVFNGELIAGGFFRNAGNQVATNIAKWNGTSWSSIGAGVGNASSQSSDTVRALRVHNNELYIGGMFQTAGGVAASKIVKLLTGTTYAALASGISTNALHRVDALHSFGNDLIVGGGFTSAGGLSATNIARWIPGGEFGGAWGTMGTGLPPSVGNGGVEALQPFNGQLVAAGHITGHVRAWNGSTWTTLGGGMTGGLSFPGVFTLNVFNGNLIAAGTFSTAGGFTATSIAQWNTSQWSALNAPTPQVFAFETFNSRFIAAGSFFQSTTNQTPANNIIGWNGTTLTRVQNQFCCGEGTNGTVRALKSYASASAMHLVAGGDFTVAGGGTANRIAQYDQLQILGSGWVSLGAGFNSTVYAIERFNNVTYAGGLFTQSGGTGLNRIAQFNGTNWVALGSGMNGTVNALKVFNGFLYAGGEFTTAGGLGTGCLARWNGSVWSTFSGLPGNILAGSVTALEVHNNKLYIANTFGSGFHLLEHSGTSAPLVGTANGIITSLKSDGQHLYVLGGFTTVAGVAANRVARWNTAGGWSDVEGGTSDVVNTLGVYRGEIHVGLGIFIGLNDGGSGDVPENPAPQPGKGWVRYSPTGTAWVAGQPISQTINCNQTATYSAQPAPGYSLLLATWHKNGIALNDGPTGHGSTISGAHAGTLTITGARSFDAGAYSCSFSNLCGSATSSAATLTVNNCCNPDIDGNNFANVDDLLAVINQWGPCPAPPASCLADIAPASGNGFVNVDDLLMVINGWGACP